MNVLQFPKSKRDVLIESHMHLVPVIARNVKEKLPPSFEVDDLEGEGYLGLIQAADSWDPSRGPFESRARYKIHMAMVDSARRKNYRVNTMPSLDEPMASNDYHKQRVLDYLEDSGRELTIGTTEANRAKRHTESEAVARIDEDRKRQLVRKSVARITPRVRRVIEIYYHEDGSMGDAGRELGVQSSRASQIHQEGLRELSRELAQLGIDAPYDRLKKRPIAA